MADISRGLVDVKTKSFSSCDASTLATRFDNMMTNVSNMFANNGPIYTVWIYFQLGLSSPIIFNTSSTNKNQNLIASLNMKKGSSGCANTFTLSIKYDAFNFGQETTDQIEKLDELIASAMKVDWNSETDDKKMQGILQYGYSGTGNNDNNLVSPQYKFYLTKADSKVKFDSGLSEYTFEGVSSIAGDCNFTTNFEKADNIGLMKLLGNVLYKHYGKVGNPPNGADSGVQPMESALGYYIDIPQNLVDDQIEVSVPAATDMSPWQYCLNKLAEYPLTKSQSESNEYSDLTKLKFDEIPRYTMYITDDKDRPTIHIAHITPKESDKNITIGGKEGLTWSLQKKNIVTEWSPEVDLYTYLIRKFNQKRYDEQKEKGGINIDDDEAKKNGVTEGVTDSQVRIEQRELLELYNATLKLVGIPADPPLTAEIRISPRILQTVSRTAGVYIITDCEDDISTNGTYYTTLKLFRTRSLTEGNWTTTPNTETATQTTTTNKAETEKEKQAAISSSTGVTSKNVPTPTTTKSSSYTRTTAPSVVEQISSGKIEVKIVSAPSKLTPVK